MYHAAEDGYALVNHVYSSGEKLELVSGGGTSGVTSHEDAHRSTGMKVEETECGVMGAGWSGGCRSLHLRCLDRLQLLRKSGSSSKFHILNWVVTTYSPHSGREACHLPLF